MKEKMCALLFLCVFSMVLSETSDGCNSSTRDSRAKRLRLFSSNANDDSSDFMPDSVRVFLEWDDERSEVRERYFSSGDACRDLPVAVPHSGNIRRFKSFSASGSSCWMLCNNPNYYVCDDPDWTEVNLMQFPDTLVYLKVNATNITNFGAGSFRNKSITYLEISDHNPISFDPDAFQDLRNVEFLRIRDNFWTVTDEIHSFFHTFRYLDRLSEMVLEGNSLVIKNVDKQQKSNDTVLPMLSYLSLKDNKLERLEKEFFWELRKSPLVTLNLHTAGLTEIDNNAFASLAQLQHMDLFGNSQLSVPSLNHYLPLALDSVNKDYFTHLGLGNIGLLFLPYSSAKSVSQNLRSLNLSKNLLKNLGYIASNTHNTTALPSMPALQELVLEDNFIEDVHPDTFLSLSGLKKLSLRGNMLKALYTGIAVDTLEELDISFQCDKDALDYSEKWQEYFGPCKVDDDFNLEPNIFLNMSSLRTLRLSGLDRDVLLNGSFEGLTNLQLLQLDKAQLKSLKKDVFVPLGNLKTLNMSHNYYLYGLEEGSFNDLVSLETLDLTKSSSAFASVPYVNWDYYLPKVLNISTLRELILKCTFSKGCGEGLPHDFDSPIPIGVMKQLPLLEYLDLSENGLTSWEDFGRFEHNEHLGYINLATNGFRTITEGMLSNFEHMLILDFSDNSFVHCDSGVVAFYDMAVKLNDQLELIGWDGGEGYFCLNDLDTPISYRSYWSSGTGLDEWQLAAIIGVVVTILLLVVAYSISAYRNRYFHAYRVLKLRDKRFQEKKRDIDSSSYKYDVFICYSEEEREWVMEELLPALEDREPKVRACVHERDFEVGVTVVQNIVECLDKSRKFLMVLSKGFPASKWCMFETHLAQSRLMVGKEAEVVGRDNLIVVVRDEPDEANKVLQYILRTWTYLKWPTTEQADHRKKEVFFAKLKQSVLRFDSSI